MFNDAAIADSMDAALRGIPAPPLPLDSILHKMHTPAVPRASARALYVRAAIAAAAVLGVLAGAYPATSGAVIQSLESRYRAALQALGGTAPPPVPDALLRTMHVQRVTPAMARTRVPFTLVLPAGLPRDVTASRIDLAGTGVYKDATHAWRRDGNAVTFTYARSGGRSFNLLADRYDPRDNLPGKYMFEAKDAGPDGRPVLVKHEHFAWRNGDQIMSATAGPGISAGEILSIERAMRGTALTLRDLHGPRKGTQSKVYILP